MAEEAPSLASTRLPTRPPSASGSCGNIPAAGKVAEWLKALVLKTSEEKSSVGSNPTLSATPIGTCCIVLARTRRYCPLVMVRKKLPTGEKVGDSY